MGNALEAGHGGFLMIGHIVVGISTWRQWRKDAAMRRKNLAVAAKLCPYTVQQPSHGANHERNLLCSRSFAPRYSGAQGAGPAGGADRLYHADGAAGRVGENVRGAIGNITQFIEGNGNLATQRFGDLLRVA